MIYWDCFCESFWNKKKKVTSLFLQEILTLVFVHSELDIFILCLGLFRAQPPAEDCWNIPVHVLPKSLCRMTHLVQVHVGIFITNLPPSQLIYVLVVVEGAGLYRHAGRHGGLLFSFFFPPFFFFFQLCLLEGSLWGAQVKFRRFLALKDLLWISNSSLWAVLTPVVNTVSTFLLNGSSVMELGGCRRVGVLVLFIFSPALHLCWQLI